MNYFFNSIWKAIIFSIWKAIIFIFKRAFLTDSGYFNWISVTGIIAIITLIWTVSFNSKKYRADLVSKARIDWMNQVRPLYAQYLAAVPHYIFLYSKAMVDNDENARATLDDEMDEIKRLYYELNLYVPHNKSNKIILDDIDLLWNELSYIVPYFNYGNKKGLFRSELNRYRRSNYESVVDEYISGLINKSSADGNKYFKVEWEKIKKGK